ncbi:beta-ketoacyl-[acyl-carrier-protein] synthase family protein [Actinocrinis puniceicyclus]|uniref:Beta-ketoacyl-[acyl-carrier-protein] synthase family protein n=1 Tax=Actinocrinis puniceicyclus TaxID=977794 RepID=A0A8J7WTC6_9ACTN|nr:beta-ketoacyl-[acyl-carrier-protein] synthase family protein [Actinocrinis puniceicyclus]MBS2964834.1 beta-ketoacyl-[acyl-carrier-protein] synthase family protein [Actinocrinis puniceicyclus]
MDAIVARRGVVVTGIGIVCPLGASADDLWQGLAAGRSGIGPVTRFDPSRFKSRLAGEVDEAALSAAPGPLHFEIRRMSAFVRYAVFAADRAIEDSGLEPAADGGGVCLGVSMGGLPNIEAGVLTQERRGVHKTSPFLIPSLIPSMATSMIALRHGIGQEQVTITGACASGCQALGHALREIRSGARTWMIAGGSEAVITPITYSGLQAMGALSRSEDPQRAPRPFDRDRDGLIVGEAAAVFVLEDRAHAEGRGAVIYGELAGYAANSGREDITGISASQAAACMNGAIADAGLTAGDVDCVFAQASGMVQGDAAELEAVRLVTADARRRPVVTSIKGNTGYTFGANGPVNLAAALMALRHQVVPATLHLEKTDPSFVDVDIAREPRPTEVNRCVVNAFGFGGIKTSLIVSRAK